MFDKIVINIGQQKPELIEITYAQAQILFLDLKMLFGEKEEVNAFDDPTSWQSILSQAADEIGLTEDGHCDDENCAWCGDPSAIISALTDKEIAEAVDEYARENALIDSPELQEDYKNNYK